MAVLRLGGGSSLISNAGAGRRRAARSPAGWLTVEVETETRSGGRRLAGRLVDTSIGGLGVVLDDQMSAGTIVRVTPTAAGSPPGASEWHGRRARVAHAVPLPGGSWRVGLTFAAPAGSDAGRRIWGTRVLLLAVFAVASASVLFSDQAGSAAGVMLGGVAVALAAGAERQHFADTHPHH